VRARDIRELSGEELDQKLAELTEERFRLRFRSATEQIDNPLQFRTLRRDIARIKTVLRERAGQAEGTTHE
jgi:large subunit ribosomal protein L29